ncbi:reverse transcriptase domain-containing protein [Novosphingobium sp.]|uniref:reverse transcriptase domain-containing protein n=1 Tax=Novosphingobium sp. TaxID=1874826 RepID=UPI002FE2E73F
MLPPAIFGGNATRVKLPAELATQANLLAYLGMTPAELKVIGWYTAKMYHTFSIQKKSGKPRIINAPDRRLKILQTKISRLLTPLYRRRNPVHGFVTERSVKTNAKSHLGSKYIVNVDLQDFFGSISYGRVAGVLRSFGIHRDVADAIATICCLNGVLPQGAPSSPLLSNMVCFRLDRKLMELAKEARCIYTRYADDLSFSSYQPLTALFEGPPPSSGHFSPNILSNRLKLLLAGNGFLVNPTKAHYADRNSRRTVTGIRINEGLNLDRRFVRNLRATLFSVETLGVTAAEAKYHASYGGKSTIGAHLQGKLAWLGHIKGPSDPVFRILASRFNKAFPALKFEIHPTQDQIRDRSVWLVEHWEGTGDQGTAFFLKGVGLVTAEHCVSPSGQVELYHPSKPANKFLGSVKHRCPNRDLAVLDHNIPANEYYEFDSAVAAAATGDPTTAVGYPGFGPGDKLNVRPGPVTSLPIKSGVQMVEVQQMLTQGMSGGPLLNNNDEVVGVIHKGGPNFGRQLAIAVNVLHAWIP